MTYQKDEVFDVAALEIQAGYNRPYAGDRKCEMLMEAQRPYLLLDRYVAVNRTSPQDPQFNPPVIPVEVMNVSAVKFRRGRSSVSRNNLHPGRHSCLTILPVVCQIVQREPL